MQNDISEVMKRRQQNQKLSFHFLSGSPHTPRRKRIGKEIFGFVGRPEGARGAQSLHALRAYDLVQSHHALGAWIIRQNPADFVHTMFELRPKNTATYLLKLGKLLNINNETNSVRAETVSKDCFWGFETLSRHT